MGSTVYRLMKDSSKYPYEVLMYNPRVGDKKPDWLTDILKFNKVNDEGIVEFQESIDRSGNITYQVPSIGGHLSIPSDCIIIYDLGSRSILPMKLLVFESLYRKENHNSISIRNLLKSISKIIRGSE